VRKTDYSSLFFTSYLVASVLWIGFILRNAVRKSRPQDVMMLEEEHRRQQGDWKSAAAQLSRHLRELVS